MKKRKGIFTVSVNNIYSNKIAIITATLLTLCVLVNSSHSQEITLQDYIGTGNALYDGNTDFTSEDDDGLGLYAYSAQRIRFDVPTQVTEVWAVVVPYNGFDFDSPDVIQYRIAVWSNNTEQRQNPNAPDIGEVTIAAPNLGDTTTPVGTGFYGDDMFLIGFDIEALGLNVPVCTACRIAIIVENDFENNGAIGIAESDENRRPSFMITNSDFYPRTQPQIIRIERDLAWAQTSRASLAMLFRGRE